MPYLFLSLAALCFVTLARRKNPRLRILLVAANAIMTVVYLVYRVTTIPYHNLGSLLPGILFFAAELMGAYQFFITEFLFLRTRRAEKKTIHNLGGKLPSVDVFICTYNEPEQLLERTMIAAANLIYAPEKLHIYICDDGRRESVRALCGTYGIGYITRENNEGAKAGNLNNALRQTHSELFAVLDADMLCKNTFLARTVGYFADKKTAFVQTPQVYYNKDMYQRNLNGSVPNEQDFFMRDIQAGRASYNAVLHVGTNAVFRREYIEEIGGYPTCSITEDMAVGLMLQAKGYRGEFVNEMLVLGLSASNYTDLSVQRDRWCRGNLQVARKFHILSNSGLSFMQKLLYFDGTLYWFTGFQKMIFLLCPIWYLLTGLPAISANAAEIAGFVIPYWVSTYLVFHAVVPNTRSMAWAHLYEIALAPHNCMSVIRELLRVDSSFRVTPKQQESDRDYFQLSVILPHLLFLLLSIAAWGVGTWRAAAGMVNFSAFLINVVWAVYNMAGILVCIRVAYHLGRTPRRFEAPLAGGYPTYAESGKKRFFVRVCALTQSSALLAFSAKVRPKEEITVYLPLGRRMLPVKAEVLNREAGGGTVRLELDTTDKKRALMQLYLLHLRPPFAFAEK